MKKEKCKYKCKFKLFERKDLSYCKNRCVDYKTCQDMLGIKQTKYIKNVLRPKLKKEELLFKDDSVEKGMEYLKDKIIIDKFDMGVVKDKRKAFLCDVETALKMVANEKDKEIGELKGSIDSENLKLRRELRERDENVKKILSLPLGTDNSQESLLRCKIISNYRNSLLERLGLK